MKYYVWNDKIQVIVMAESPIGGVAEALSYCGFTDSTDIPDHLISWGVFSVDEQGFRHVNGTMVEVELGDQTTQSIQSPMYTINKDIALDFFDNAMAQYDPFCEDEDFE